VNRLCVVPTSEQAVESMYGHLLDISFSKYCPRFGRRGCTDVCSLRECARFSNRGDCARACVNCTLAATLFTLGAA